MTFLEIYNLIVAEIWQDSTPPSSASTILKGEFGTINRACKKIQRDYNYWFMREEEEFSTTSGVNTKDVSDLKKLISLRYADAEGNYNIDLEYIGGESDFTSSDEAEYASEYKVEGNQLIFSPTPNAAKDLKLVYFKFFPALSDDADENDLTIYAGDAIKDLAISYFMQIKKEFDLSNIYKNNYLEDLESLREEDRDRRQRYNKEYSY